MDAAWSVVECQVEIRLGHVGIQEIQTDLEVGIILADISRQEVLTSNGVVPRIDRPQVGQLPVA